ncbi:zinc finger, C2H2 type [Ancylostoma duodenale]|uniref:Zinc finger, C2H2 type n=1 Tax=Ancylostoma duodenale TaxID=51022 RepID=A0A0C2GRB9_9BILA|nr:zinc finger, C2H2 type [Ancylostoma duodenale]
MTTPINPGPSGLGAFEALGSPRSERNYGGISPIVHPGRFSHPDLRYWDAGVPFFTEATPFASFIEQGSGFEELAQQCEATEVVLNNIEQEMQFIPLENTAFVSEQVQFPPPPPQPDPLIAVPEVPVPEVPVEEIVVQPVESVQQDEEITQARCIDCDRIIDSRGAVHDSCTKCSASFNFERNLDVHLIVEHSSQSMLRRHRRLVHGLVEEEMGLENYSAELGYCPHCCSMVALEQVEGHRLLHSLHLQLDNRKKRLNARKEKARKTVEALKAASETASGSKETKRKRHFMCDRCDKSFSRSSDLARHSAVHGSEKKWNCTMCDRKYTHKAGLDSHKSNLNRHIKMQHPLGVTKAVLDCPECTCVFGNRRTLTRHRREAHGTDLFSAYYCRICNRCFPKISLLRRHNLVHDQSESSKPYQCNRCFKRFNLKSTLKLHMDIHSRKDVDDPVLTNPKCPICLKHEFAEEAHGHPSVQLRVFRVFPGLLKNFQLFIALINTDVYRKQCYKIVEMGNSSSSLPTREQSHKVGPVNHLRNITARFVPAPSTHFGATRSTVHSIKDSGRTCVGHVTKLLELHKEVHNRGPVYCEYCPAILQGRNQYTQHVHSLHQTETGGTKQIGVNLVDRVEGVASTQSFPELTGRELAENLFRTRAQSADHNDHDAANGKTKANAFSVGDSVCAEDRPVRCEVCRHLYYSVLHLVEHWMNSGFDRDHSFCVLPCPLCGYSANGVLAGVEHMKEFHAHILERARNKNQEMQQSADEIHGEDSDDDPDEPSGEPLDKVMCITKKHKCQLCTAAFTKPSDLVRHNRVHTGWLRSPEEKDRTAAIYVKEHFESPVRCTLTFEPIPGHRLSISVLFVERSSLALHLRIHNGDKPLKCRRCNLTFRTSASRRRHEITWHGAPGGHVCKRSPCPICSASKRRRMFAEMGANQLPPPPAPVPEVTGQSKAPVAANKTLLPVKRLATSVLSKENTDVTHSKQFEETVAQISKLPATGIKRSEGSAFGPVARTTHQPNAPEVEFFITARRISHNEYSVNFSKTKPKSIRSQVDTMVNLGASLLLDSASKNASIHLTLSDSQILSVSCVGVVKAMQSCDSVVMRARPADPSCPSTVELLPPPEVVEFIGRCDVCEVDLPSKEASDAHFASEDHETAQITQPLPTAVHDAIDHSMLPAAAVPLQRKDEKTDFTCKLCGRKFLDMEPLVAHIRLEHERDHPQGITRPLARTAPIH